MKNLIIITAIAALFLGSASAQSIHGSYNLVGGAYGLTIDTVDNTDDIIKYIKVEGIYSVISIQAVVTKISGTVAGTIVPVVSLDGVNFVPASRASVAISALRPAYKDTLTCTNVTTNTKVWTFTNQANIDGSTPNFQPYLWYGLRYVGAGTMSAKFRAYLVPTVSKNN